MNRNDPRIDTDAKSNRGSRTSTGTTEHDFDVVDNKGHAVGAAIYYGKVTYAPQIEGSFGYCSIAPGDYITFTPSATRAGRSFGAVQQSRTFMADEEGELLRDAAVAKYLKSAKKRAVKRWIVFNTPAETIDEVTVEKVEKKAAAIDDVEPNMTFAPHDPSKHQQAEDRTVSLRSFAVRVFAKEGNSWIASYGEGAENHVVFAKGEGAERFAASHRACPEVIGAVVIDSVTLAPPVLPCDMKVYTGARITFARPDGSWARAITREVTTTPDGILHLRGIDSRGVHFAKRPNSCVDVECPGDYFQHTVGA